MLAENYWDTFFDPPRILKNWDLIVQKVQSSMSAPVTHAAARRVRPFALSASRRH